MRPGTYDLDLYRGDSYAWEFHLWDDEAKTAATDLTVVTVRRATPGHARPRPQ